MLYQLIIVDDEPIIQLGVSSLIDYGNLNIEIIKISATGEEALKDIRQLTPQLVLLDINIPGQNGLEVMEQLKREMDTPPQFIILSCHDEFEYAKRAVRLGAVDYLLKSELNAALLTSVLQKAILLIKPVDFASGSEISTLYTSQIDLRNNFFMKLLNNWFDSSERMEEMMRDFQISFNGSYFICATIGPSYDQSSKPAPYSLTLLTGLCSFIPNLCKSYCRSYTFPCDATHFALVMAFDQAIEGYTASVFACIQHIVDMMLRYQNMHIYAGIGTPRDDLADTPYSYNESSIAFSECNAEQPITLYEKLSSPPHSFNIGFIRRELTAAFENYDPISAREQLGRVLDILQNNATRLESALAICSSISHFVAIAYKGSDQLLNDAASSNAEGTDYTLYRCKTVAQTIQWFRAYINLLCEQMQSDFESKKNWLLPSIKKYIEEHYEEPISLTDISQSFNISSAYLSSTFKKINGIGISECVTQAKIKHAKQLLLEPRVKIYDVAYRLGFSDPYYFSKVFKKATGLSPREYMMKNKVVS